MDERLRAVGEFWSAHAGKDHSGGRLHWTSSKAIVSHVATRICGAPCERIPEAIAGRMRSTGCSLPFRRGISVGCGNGLKEMALLEQGIVSHFDLYEVAEENVRLCQKHAAEKGLENRVRALHGNALAAITEQAQYDFIYWDNALHHMFDTDQAVAWSKHILRPGGLFFMYDFVGPNHFQWSDDDMKISSMLLESIEDKYFFIPDSDYMWVKKTARSTVEEMLASDPSEAADSEAILPAFQKHFPHGTIIPLGGLVYILCLDGIIINIPDNSPLLARLLTMDATLAAQGRNYYVAAYAIR